MQAGISFTDGGWFRRSMRLTATLLAFVLCFQSTSAFISIAAQRASKKFATMTSDQRVAHVLSRLTFGARPGDAEQVRKVGLKKWIDQQLHPGRIAENPVLEEKLKYLDTLRLTHKGLD